MNVFIDKTYFENLKFCVALRCVKVSASILHLKTCLLANFRHLQKWKR